MEEQNKVVITKPWDEKTVKEYNQNYYKTNREKLLKYLAENVNCPCCSKAITRCSLSRHMKTKKCKTFQKKDMMSYIKNLSETEKEELKKLIEN
jgi:hypothetical protein